VSIKTAVIFKFLQMSKKQQLRDLNKGGSLDLARARKDMKLFNGFMKMFAPLRTDVEIKETSLDGLFCFHVKPTKKSKRVIYYLPWWGLFLWIG